MYKVMARPFVHGMSRTAVFLGTDPFDKPEIDGGELSLGALLYQAGGKIDARVLFIAWLGSVTMPRALQWMDKKEKEKKAQRTAEIFRGDLQRATPPPEPSKP